MFGIGGSELVVIVLVALLVFGPSRIPEIARTIKRVVGELSRFRRQVDDTVSEIRQELDLRLDVDDPLSPPAPAATPPPAPPVLPPAGERAAQGRASIWPAPRTPTLPVAGEDDYLAPAPQAGNAGATGGDYDE